NGQDPLGLFDWNRALAVGASSLLGAALVAGAVVLTVGTGGLAAPFAIMAMGAAAGALGFGMNEALNQVDHNPDCPLDWNKIVAEGMRGAIIGEIAAIPFVFAAAAGATGLAAVGLMGVAGIGSGALSYSLDVATSERKWDWGDFGLSML